MSEHPILDEQKTRGRRARAYFGWALVLFSYVLAYVVPPVLVMAGLTRGDALRTTALGAFFYLSSWLVFALGVVLVGASIPSGWKWLWRRRRRKPQSQEKDAS